MALVQHITTGIGGTVSITPTSRPTNAYVTVYDGGGTAVTVNTNATISTINTTLTNAVNARGKSITVSNSSGIAEGGRFFIAAPVEWCRAKVVSGNAVTLWHPLREAHSNNATVQGTTCTLSVSATNASASFWDGRVRWELDGALQYTGVECTKYPLNRVTTEQDILDVNPQFGALLAAEEDPNTALDAAHAYVLEVLGQRGRARCYPASSEFAQAVALAFARNHYRAQSSDVAEKMYERFAVEFNDAMARLAATLANDEDQDGVVEAEEKRSMMSFRIER